jgi:eukaryotic-like serine/threonine-protein kinase
MGPDTTKVPVQSVGNYDLIEKIAEGGMGGVFRARNRVNGEIVAIKIMPAHMAANPVLLKRFEQEFRAASKMDHPNIVRALDFGAGVTPFLVMEFVEGESLGQKIERDGKMPEAESIRIIAQVAQGLHRAHKQNLIHRDVKPDNILLRPDGVAKLADLGLVKETDTDLNLTKTGRGLGTPHFMAPEQFRNAKNADIRCDIYSLGATLYMMVTGELPFRSNGPLDAWMKKIQNDLTPPRRLVPSLSERIDWAIMRAMSADPEKRPNTCREFVEDLTGHSTRRAAVDENNAAMLELWYLVYKDEMGVPHTVKGSAAAIRRSLREGLLGDATNIRAGRSKHGPFEPLRGYPEFRDMVVTAAPLSLPTPPPPRSNPTAAATPSQRRAKPDPSDAENAPFVPHLTPSPAGAGGAAYEWLKWVFLLAVALASAAAAYYFLPVP